MTAPPVLVRDDTPPPPRCGAVCPKNRYARCEVPPGHTDAHVGRDRQGKWWTWGVTS